MTSTVGAWQATKASIPDTFLGVSNMFCLLFFLTHKMGVRKLTYHVDRVDPLLSGVLPPHEVGVRSAGVVHARHDGKEAGAAAVDVGRVRPENTFLSRRESGETHVRNNEPTPPSPAMSFLSPSPPPPELDR